MNLITLFFNYNKPDKEPKETENLGKPEDVFARIAKANERCAKGNVGQHKFKDPETDKAFWKWYDDPKNLAKAGLDMW